MGELQPKSGQKLLTTIETNGDSYRISTRHRRGPVALFVAGVGNGETNNDESEVKNGRSTSTKRKQIRRRVGSIGLSLALLGGSPVLVGCQGGNNSGNITSITVEGYKVNSQFYPALDAAGNVCSGYTIEDATGQFYDESGGGTNEGPVTATNGTIHEGPAMFDPKSDLWKEYKKYGNGNIWDPSSLVAMAHVVCDNISYFNGSVTDGIAAFFTGRNGLQNAGDYPARIAEYASTVHIDHDFSKSNIHSGNSGGHNGQVSGNGQHHNRRISKKGLHDCRSSVTGHIICINSRGRQVDTTPNRH